MKTSAKPESNKPINNPCRSGQAIDLAGHGKGTAQLQVGIIENGSVDGEFKEWSTYVYDMHMIAHGYIYIHCGFKMDCNKTKTNRYYSI